jgi:AAA ATPase containing von Willebrand factor type A (vWA) domain
MKERLMRIFDKNKRLKIIAIVLGCICMLSVIMSIWHVGRSVSGAASTAETTLMQQEDETQMLEDDSAFGEGNLMREDAGEAQSLEEENLAAQPDASMSTESETAGLDADISTESDTTGLDAHASTQPDTTGRDAHISTQPDNTGRDTMEAEQAGIDAQVGAAGADGIAGGVGLESSETPQSELDAAYAGDIALMEELYGDLIITNYVEAQGEEILDLEKAFHFTIKVGEEVYEHALRIGESYRIENIPEGTPYEIVGANYLSEYYVNENRRIEGFIVQGENHQMFHSMLTPAPEVERMIEEGLIIDNEEYEIDLTEMQTEPEVLQEPEVSNALVTAEEQEVSHYIGEISMPKETHPMAAIVWLIILMASIVALKVVIVTPWLKQSL